MSTFTSKFGFFKNLAYLLCLFYVVQTLDKLIHRSLAHHTGKHEQSDPKEFSLKKNGKKTKENGDDTETSGVNAVIETKGAREAREKAKWERLSFVERFVKKYLPTRINSIVIFVNNYLL